MRTLVLFVVFSLAFHAAAAPTSQPDGRVHTAVTELAERGLIASPSDWETQLAPGNMIDGAKVGPLLVSLANSLKPAKTLAEAVDVLAERGVISSTAYWNKQAVAGKTCDGKNLAEVIVRVAARQPVTPPKSVNAKPLAPVAPAAIRPSYDVVIAGAGCGGCGAAIQAARMGCSVLLLEETDWIGGQATAAAVTSMDEGVTLVRERGLYRELCGHIWAHYQPLGINPETAYGHRHPAFEPRVGQQILYTLLGDAKGTSGTLDVVLRSTVTKVSKAGAAVTGVEVQSVTDAGPPPPKAVACKVLIDATEWGDVIPLTGARYRTGNCLSDGTIDRTRHIQDITWTAVVKQYPKGVPDALRVTSPPPGYAKIEPRFLKSLEVGKGELAKPPQGTPWSWDRFIGYRAMPDSDRPNDMSTRVTRTHLNFNNDYPATVADIEDPKSRLATNRAAIVRTLNLLYYIQEKLGKSDWSVTADEGYDTPYNRAQMDALIADQPELAPYRAVLYHFSVTSYARESRRIVGLHTLVAREIERKPGKPIQFPHTVALGDYAVDLHGSATPPYLEMDLDRPEDIAHAFGEHGIGPFAIPFECFIPETVDGFLPAEKNLSQSRLANGATRLQPHTLNMGQAVGVIAALAVKNHVQPRAVDPEAAQHVLLDAGATLSIAPVTARWGTDEWKAQQWLAVHPTGR